MGCGQSKIHLYPRKSKSKANGKKGGHADSDAETDDDEGHIENAEKYQNREHEKSEENEEQSNKDTQDTDEDVSVSLLRAKNLSLLQSQEISTSQQNFFRMLDKKIDEGPDYDSASETEIALEEARLNALVQHWESASITASICSSASRSLQTTPIRLTPSRQVGTTPRPAMLQATIVPQQIMSTAEFLPHVSPQSAQLLAGSQQQQQQLMQQQQLQLQLSHSQNQQQQQQIIISQMNSKIIHPMAIASQIPLSMPSDTSVTTANTSNALAVLQASSQSQQFQSHLMTLPTTSGSPQLLGNKPNASPKHNMDTPPRVVMNPSPLAHHRHAQQIQNQFIPAPATAISTPPQTFANGGRSQPPPMPMPMQMAYFGQTTAQPSAQTIHEQQLQQQQQHQQQQQQIPQSQNQSYYGDTSQNIQAPTEYRFPPAISVQRLAPQVQRQLRETQELIKDSCPQLYAAGYGSPGPPPIRNQTRNPTRRPTLETQFSQESS